MRLLLPTTLILAIFATAQAPNIEKHEPTGWITPSMWDLFPRLKL